jgi:gluconate kinase
MTFSIMSSNLADEVRWNVACALMSKVLFFGGPAGSGKTTLGDAVAGDLGVPHIDFDEATAPVVSSFRATHPHVSEADALRETRTERYQALCAEILASIQTNPRVVVSAPLRQESATRAAWQTWIAPLEAAGAQVELIWLDLSADERRRRMSRRGLLRDAPAVAASPDERPPPEAADRILDARLPLPELLAQVRSPSGSNFDIS